MIHAYLFILNIREGNGGHGPNFVKIMNGINRTAGTNITVYHTFHDEVNHYRVHVWKCNGICQHRKPFNGLVKRTSNRAPGPNDIWWAKHQQTCSGTFQKIAGPEPKQKAKKQKPNLPKITDFWNKQNQPRNGPNGSIVAVRGAGGSNTIVVKPSSKAATATSQTGGAITYEPSSSVGGNLRNVIGFKDLNGSGEHFTSILQGKNTKLKRYYFRFRWKLKCKQKASTNE